MSIMLIMSCYTGFFNVAISQHGTSVLFTSHPQDGLVVNCCIPHNRRTPLQAEEALGPISISRDSRGVLSVGNNCVEDREVKCCNAIAEGEESKLYEL
jgi:hypothetical protein